MSTSNVDSFIKNKMQVQEDVLSPLPTVDLIRMSDVEPREPEFLWFPYLRLDNLNLLRGNGGSGKTSLCFALTAAISNGLQPANMPGVLNIDRPHTVIYLGTEDDQPEYRAMLDRQGADPNNVIMPSGRVPTLGEVATIEAMIRQTQAALLIVDPVQALLPDGVDMNKSNEVRPILEGLRDVCRRANCTALLLEHLNKATKAANTYRGSGSMDFFNASRSVLITGWTPEGGRTCGHLKSNGAAYGQSIIFEIDSKGRFVWADSDPTIGGEDILTTRMTSKNGLQNPYELLIKGLASGAMAWEGTASEAVSLAPQYGVSGALSGEGFGKALKSLNVAGVTCTAHRTSRGNIYRIEGAKHDAE